MYKNRALYEGCEDSEEGSTIDRQVSRGLCVHTHIHARWGEYSLSVKGIFLELVIPYPSYECYIGKNNGRDLGLEVEKTE